MAPSPEAVYRDRIVICAIMSLQSEARRLQKAGYTVMGIQAKWDPTKNKKDLRFKPNWQTGQLDTCLAQLFERDDTGLAILTGDKSDLFIVDLDVPKPKDIDQGISDALNHVKALIDEHSLHPSVPIAETASGGLHLYFKLSASLENGLMSASNASKCANMTLDVRGDGGCVICSPTTIQHPEGPRRYKWLQSLVPTVDLQPIPAWLLNLINQQKRKASTTLAPVSKKQRILDTSMQGEIFISSVREQMAPRTIATIWPRVGGIDFKLQDTTCTCMICGNVHLSNNFCARVIVEEAFTLRSYSTSCRTKVYGWVSSAIIKELLVNPCIDDTFCSLLDAVYKIQGRTICFTEAKRFLSFNGVVWEPINPQLLKQDIKYLNGQVIKPLAMNIPKTEENEVKIKALAQARKFIGKAHNVSSILQTFETLAYKDQMEDQLDTNPDLLAVANGVLDLPTGTLVSGQPSQRLSIQLDTAFHHKPTPLIDAFFGSIFNDNQDVIRYMQRLLGYGITGHTREQIWVIWTGTGSNGKSLLLEVIKTLIGQFAVMMPGELLFETGKTTAGASTPHLQCLIKKRIGFKDEGKAEKQNVLNEELIKTVTGSSTIATKPLYREFIEFQPSHLPILLCNKRPQVNVHDAAMMRRIVVIPFTNKYTSPDALQDPYDPSNPTHRLRNDTLRDILLSQEGQEQLLTWLVQGAQQWYANGLGKVPPTIAAAFNEYKEENDHLSAFIRECCVMEASAQCNASQFLQALNGHAGTNLKQKDLRELMAKRDIKYFTKGRFYRGIQLLNGSEDHLMVETC